jgi:hypothetical protein
MKTDDQGLVRIVPDETQRYTTAEWFDYSYYGGFRPQELPA